ncbi:hypothetical protein M378DRAFT_165641, partial [Amanita muscaria Koide BX008]
MHLVNPAIDVVRSKNLQESRIPQEEGRKEGSMMRSSSLMVTSQSGVNFKCV